MRSSSGYGGSSSAQGQSLNVDTSSYSNSRSNGGSGGSQGGPVVPYPSSTLSPTSPETPVARDLSAGILKGDIVPPRRSHISGPGEVAVESLRGWDDDLAASKEWTLAQTVLTRVKLSHILLDRQAEIKDIQVFNTQITTEGTPVANQLQSGRCWLFATTNVIRIFCARLNNLDDFQLSQSYLWFYDHIEKAGWFLEQAIDLAEEPLDSRTNQYIFAGTETQDGGQYDMAVNLILKYGLVPQAVYPESWNSSHSDEVDALVASKLREQALVLRKVYNKARKAGDSHPAAVRKAQAVKEEQLGVIYRMLAIMAGTPPDPHEKFIWEFRDKDKKYNRIETTPRQFAEIHCGYNSDDGIAIVNDPRNEYGKLYTVQRLGNVVGGARDIRYFNADISVLKQAAIKALKDNTPVWFGSNVEKAKSFTHGILDTALYNYDNAFGTTLEMTKAQQLQTGDTSMTHAMMLTGVHQVAGNSVRWRVENSWGDAACTKGFFCMSDAWFDENVFQVVVPRCYAPADLVRLYDNQNAPVVELPPWDPMGALAKGSIPGQGSTASASGDGAAMRALALAMSNAGLGSAAGAM